VIGSVLLVGAIGYIVITAIGSASRADASREITLDETFDEVDVTVEVVDVIVEYAAVDETVLTFAQNDDRRDMTFDAEVSGSTLHVSVVDHGIGWWMPFDFNDSPRLTVTLPEALEGVDLTMDSDVGDVTLNGTFGEVDFTGNVGDLHLEGSADRADIETTVGDIGAKNYSVTGELTISSNTGDVTLELDTVPTALDVTSNVGDQNITIPRGSYRIDTSTNVGEMRVEADNDSDSDTVLRFETTVGDITVRN
jgi:hypothetical protein